MVEFKEVKRQLEEILKKNDFPYELIALGQESTIIISVPSNYLERNMEHIDSVIPDLIEGYKIYIITPDMTSFQAL